MTTTEAIDLLISKFPERYISISAEINSHCNEHTGRRASESTVNVYVARSRTEDYAASTLALAVQICLDDNGLSESSDAEAVIASAETPEATYPPMTVEEAEAASDKRIQAACEKFINAALP